MSTYKEVVDHNGRVYRVGEAARDLMGHDRILMLVLPWIAMMLASALEYGWGAASATVANQFHWNLTTAFWNYSVYVLFEAGISYFNGYLRENNLLKAKHAILIGGVLVGLAYFFLANSVAPWIAYVGYAALGGIGSGLVYSTCVAMVSKWYPEKKGWRTGFVDGGWAYGAVPFIILYGADFNTHDFMFVLYMTGLILGGGLILVSFWFQDPPTNWWPAEVDPIHLSKTLRKHPPALRQCSTKEMWRTPQPFWMLVEFMLIAGTSLFGVGFYYPFGQAMHLGAVIVIAGATGFAFTDGVGRPLVGWLEDSIGSQRAMVWVYSILGVSSLMVLWAGEMHNAFLYVVTALIAGGTSGSLFVLNPLMTSDYYGENHLTENYGTIYAAKIVGGFYGGVGSAWLISVGGYHTAFVIAGIMSLVAASIAHKFLQAPTHAQIENAVRLTGGQMFQADLISSSSSTEL